MIKEIFALAIIVSFLAYVRPEGHQPSYNIADIQAHLYYHETGTFDGTNIASDTSLILWNTIIGEGKAEGPSGATLVLVKVNGSWVSGRQPPRLRVTVQIEGDVRVLLQRTVDLNHFFTEGASVWVPFIAFGTGCGTTRVTADLVDARGNIKDKMEKSILFQCGE